VYHILLIQIQHLYWLNLDICVNTCVHVCILNSVNFALINGLYTDTDARNRKNYNPVYNPLKIVFTSSCYASMAIYLRHNTPLESCQTKFWKRVSVKKIEV